MAAKEMKTILLSVFAAFVTTLITNLGIRVWQTQCVVWYYDAQRKAYTEQQAKRAQEERERQEFLRTNKPAGQYVSSNITIVNFDGSSWTNVAYTTNAYYIWWKDVRQPQFQPGDKELGFRADGTVVFRTPPELLPTNTLPELRAKVYRGLTNLVH